MIVIKLNGGLGNQMFQYSAARMAAEKFDEELFVDDNFLNFYPFGNAVTKRQNELKVFNTRATSWAPKLKWYGLISNKLYYRVIENINLKLDSIKSIEESVFFASNLRNTYLDGYFQSETYFVAVRDVLLREFTLKEELDERNRDLFNQIRNCNSISLHVRRGDYLLPHNKKYHGVLNKDYYLSAINYIAEYYINPHFYVFSDDIKWTVDNLRDDRYEFTFVEHNNDRKSYIDMWLMAHCQSNIVANSSFSWWSAWLNVNPEKLVIAPKKWYDGKRTGRDIVPSSWLKM